MRVIEVLGTPRAEAPGRRLPALPHLSGLLNANGAVGSLACRVLGEGARPVRAVLFDKTASNNWSLGWHQDRTIVVKARREAPGFGPWTTKAGLVHVAPPASVLAGMVTLRIHLDDVAEDNAPLLVAPGSHRLGALAQGEVAEAVDSLSVQTCLARAGDVWVYATSILHASAAQRAPGRRRVLQVDYAAADLPGGLEWLGL